MKANNNHIKFRVYESGRFMNSALDCLDLSVRSYNCLKRAGYNTVGDVVDSISCSDDLKAIHSCGTKSIEEIMFKLFLFNYECLDPQMYRRYMIGFMKMNGVMKEIEDLELSSHTCLTLFRAGIFKISQLTSMTKEELHHIRSMGLRSWREIVERIEELGLSFREEQLEDSSNW